MVDRIAEQNYINAVMQRLPEVNDKKVHVLKKGENLWSLAKKELNKKNASNQEISNYMLLIAKLNNLETVDKMNGLKISDKIYLPENPVDFSAVANTKKASKVSKVEKTDKAINNQVEKTLTTAEQSIDNVINLMKNDKTIHIKRATPDFINLYHVFREKKYPSGLILKDKTVLSFNVDKNGKVYKLRMDDNVKKLHQMWYDYDVYKNGNMKDAMYDERVVTKLSKEKTQELFNEVTRLYEEYKEDLD